MQRIHRGNRSARYVSNARFLNRPASKLPLALWSQVIMSLVERIKAFSLPAGEPAAGGVRGIKTTQRGELRSGPNARWVAFAAEEYIDAMQSGFCWNAQLGTGLKSVNVIDAYENGQGRLVVKKGPLTELKGAEVDKGELQRYLAYLNYCPPMIVNNPDLVMMSVGPRTLRISDKSDQTGASVDLEVEDTGRISVARAIRPATLGRKIVMTPWSATASDFKECQGFRVPYVLEAAWEPPEGAFIYIRIELTSVTVSR
jgi:hypothetical protein